MPNLANAKKALRQTKKRTLQNAVVKRAYKDAVKVVRKTVEAGQDAKKLVQAAQKKLDKAAKKGVIKKNTAARKLSRLMKQINKKVA